MTTNRGVVYLGPGKVKMQSIDYPRMQAPNGRDIDHGVILKIVATNICGSDQHMVRGRTTEAAGLVLGHEITGGVIEKGSDVETHVAAPDNGAVVDSRCGWLIVALGVAGASGQR
jgi:glutathione-independent formaldehyde dehydrogenase